MKTTPMVTLNIQSLIDKIEIQVQPCSQDCLSALQHQKHSIEHHLTNLLTEALSNAISNVEKCPGKDVLADTEKR